MGLRVTDEMLQEERQLADFDGTILFIKTSRARLKIKKKRNTSKIFQRDNYNKLTLEKH